MKKLLVLVIFVLFAQHGFSMGNTEFSIKLGGIEYYSSGKIWVFSNNQFDVLLNEYKKFNWANFEIREEAVKEPNDKPYYVEEYYKHDGKYFRFFRLYSGRGKV
ncbi:MAG: hypothetical protein FWG29_09565 [Treponema sp.]|nr:hypothetical protein [Treponema sp.]